MASALIMRCIAIGLFAWLLGLPLQASVININFNLVGDDNNSVDADEQATSLVPGGVWNNITVREAA